MRYKIQHIIQNRPDPLQFLDRMLLVIATIGPLMNGPQIYKIFHFQEAAGVSLISWSFFTILDIPWVIYGIAHRNTPILIAYVLWFLTNATVVIGTILYG